MKFAVVTFPGSNCDDDCHEVVKEVLGQEVRFLWHKDRDLKGIDCVILPGGFSYGDYLRTGAVARFSPVMEAIIEYAQKGGPVLGICNGFQILLEAGLLPGAMLRNRSLSFICRDVFVRVETKQTPFTRRCEPQQVLKLPIAHMDGHYFADPEILKGLEGEGQIVFRYCTARGDLSEEANPNGSLSHIAGICNSKRNVLGLMPHPERASEACLGGEDGRLIFESLLAGKNGLS